MITASLLIRNDERAVAIAPAARLGVPEPPRRSVLTQNPLHTRQHGSVLAAAEKAALIWMAKRLPRWVNSDHLTLLGFAAMPLAGLSYWLASRNRLALWVVVMALALNWFGDSLDGTLARVRNQQRPRYGYYVDHVLDMIGTIILLSGLAVSGWMSPLVALAMLVAFLLMAAEDFLATHVRRVFQLSFFGFGPTELRIILAIGTVRLFYSPWSHLGSLGTFRLFDVGGAVAIVAMAVKVVISSVRNAHDLYQAEKL